MKKSERPSLVSVHDAAFYIRVAPGTIYRLLEKRELPGAFKIGRAWKIDLDELERFFKKATQALK